MSRKGVNLGTVLLCALLCLAGCSGGNSIYDGSDPAYASPLGNSEALLQAAQAAGPADIKAIQPESEPNRVLVRVASRSVHLAAEQVFLNDTVTPVELHIQPAGQSGGEHSFHIEALSLNPFVGAYQCTAGVLFYDLEGIMPATYAELEFEVKPRPLPADTLCAIPAKSHVRVGEEVSILVCTGVMSQPFEYLSGVRIACPAGSGLKYVPNSFNIGAPGGAVDTADGVWKAMLAEGFLLPLDEWFMTLKGLHGDEVLDFGIAPIKGHDLEHAQGELFNFRATFSQPGTYSLRFENKNQVDHTFYQDSSTTLNLFWSDTSNEHTGYARTVVVTD